MKATIVTDRQGWINFSGPLGWHLHRHSAVAVFNLPLHFSAGRGAALMLDGAMGDSLTQQWSAPANRQQTVAV